MWGDSYGVAPFFLRPVVKKNAIDFDWKGTSTRTPAALTKIVHSNFRYVFADYLVVFSFLFISAIQHFETSQPIKFPLKKGKRRPSLPENRLLYQNKEISDYIGIREPPLF